ncbi:hypothetical protein [Tellurirhabdus rosea]|uniref:hypothetical protein n=1 Tax=Tellurirhabdus rosea TaxID=2674997 RepID=UPI002255A03B|nr:hypothetical protein [Tellurirhabdus rosea]
MKRNVFRAGFLLLLCWMAALRPVRAAYLIWPDNPDGRLFRLDTRQKQLERETMTGKWEIVGKVTCVGVVEADFPAVTRMIRFPGISPKETLLLVDCTGQVYRFDWKTRTLTRQDHTFFRGFNCHASRFLRRDTLYSFGGYGFWRTNNLLTFYKADKGEWESIVPRTTGPAAINSGLNGYLPASDQYFSTLNIYHNDAENGGASDRDPAVWTFHFRERRWQKLGQVTASVLKLCSPENRPVSVFWSGTYLLLGYDKAPGNQFIMVNPVTNECRLWEDAQRLLNHAPGITHENLYRSYCLNDTLYHYDRDLDVDHTLAHKLKLPLARLWREAQPIGPFYEPESKPLSNWLYVGMTAGLVIAGLTGFSILRRKEDKPQLSTPAEIIPADSQRPEPEVGLSPTSLTPVERRLYEALAAAEGGLTSEQLIQALGIADKSPDNQRRIRSEVIRALNLKLKIAYGLEEAVERKPTDFDQRMMTYTLKPEARPATGA